ncbi:MAG TPA: hypothetical protein DCE78_02735, partial [Bacteroidetes bacterium]|nr:hypothetical protein [Bacteroidota bacterium]
LPRTQDLVNRFTGSSIDGKEFYKGEHNVRHLDNPAIFRRGITFHSLNKKDNEEEQNPQKAVEDAKTSTTENEKRFGTGNVILNDKEERINKGDTDQPAFLRRAMD